MTIKSRIFPIALLAGLAITAAVIPLDAPSLDASSEAGLAIQVLAVQAANAGPAATPILLAQYNPCTGGRCR
jgi:hypothetical protein